MENNFRIYDQCRTVPTEAQKTIQGGRLKGFTDINPMWRIKKLTELFGPCGFGWFTEIVSQSLEEGANGEKTAHVTINLYVKSEEGWSKPIVGVGGSMLVTQEKTKMNTSDEAYKMAYTDAISVACKALGMGADIYYANDRTKYSVAPEKTVDDVLSEIARATDPQTEMTNIWNNNKAFQKEIKDAWINKKKQLLGNETK